VGLYSVGIFFFFSEPMFPLNVTHLLAGSDNLRHLVELD
jgi:hypothetical protein